MPRAGTTIDSRAVVDPSAELGEDVEVGPFCVIGAGARIGDRCRLESHVVIDGAAALGPENVVSPMASVGGPPQDLKFRGEPSRLTIGARNRIREFVTLNRGTAGGGGETRIGDENLFMAGTHIGHDCRIGDGNVFANAATLAGHVEVADGATVGAYSGVHQFCRVAREAYIGGYSVVTRDALPWVLTVGNRATTHGLNVVGLRRRNYPAVTIRALKRCYQVLVRSARPQSEALAQIEEELGHVDEVRYFVDFVRGSQRGVTR